MEGLFALSVQHSMWHQKSSRFFPFISKIRVSKLHPFSEQDRSILKLWGQKYLKMRKYIWITATYFKKLKIENNDLARRRR